MISVIMQQMSEINVINYKYRFYFFLISSSNNKDETILRNNRDTIYNYHTY